METGKVKLTGLWKQKTQAGQPYLAGKVSPTSRLLVFPNSHKETDKDPDYIAYLAQGQDGDQAKEKTIEESWL